jgi:hypothetical protein
MKDTLWHYRELAKAFMQLRVMAGLVPATHVLPGGAKGVGARHEAGHDDGETVHQRERNPR